MSTWTKETPTPGEWWLSIAPDKRTDAHGQAACCQIVERFTDDELDAIKALHRIAQKWPASLMLVHHADSFGLQVKRVADCGDNPADAITLATVTIKTESVA